MSLLKKIIKIGNGYYIRITSEDREVRGWIEGTILNLDDVYVIEELSPHLLNSEEKDGEICFTCGNIIKNEGYRYEENLYCEKCFNVMDEIKEESIKQ